MSNTPKDSPDNPTPEIKPIQAPAGLDLHPTPQTSVRVSKRAGAAIGLVAIGLLLAFAYGGYRRQIRAQAAEHDSSLPKAVQPATASATEVEKDIPSGNATLVRNNPNQLQPPDAGKSERHWPHLAASIPGLASPIGSILRLVKLVLDIRKTEL